MMQDSSQISSHLLSTVRAKVIGWYDKHGRQFPWRTAKDPYQILIAEMLLRRTTGSAVLRVYPGFISQFSSSKALAEASTSIISKHMSTLGLQKMRTKHLKEMAKQLQSEHSGEVPSNLADLRALPGIGRYTAHAVLNFAFGHPLPLVDGNILHFLFRVFGLFYTGSSDEKAWAFMERFGGRRQDPKLYWGLIDLVARVCLRRTPRCNECPVYFKCWWYTNNEENPSPP